MNKKTKYFLIGSGIGFGLLGLQFLSSLCVDELEDEIRAESFVLLVALLAGLIWTFVKDRKNRKASVAVGNRSSLLKKQAYSAGFILGTVGLFFLSFWTVRSHFITLFKTIIIKARVTNAL